MKNKKFVNQSLILLVIVLFFLTFLTSPIDVNLSTSQAQETSHLLENKVPQIASVKMWTPNGTPICIESNDQDFCEICSDGHEGAIIVWEDNRTGINYDIYLQRIDSKGVVKWATNGLNVCNANEDQIEPKICGDGVGDAIIAWQDNRTGIDLDIYTQRIDSNGITQWTSNGVAVCTMNGSQTNIRICSGGAHHNIKVSRVARFNGAHHRL